MRRVTNLSLFELMLSRPMNSLAIEPQPAMKSWKANGILQGQDPLPEEVSGIDGAHVQVRIGGIEKNRNGVRSSLTVASTSRRSFVFVHREYANPKVIKRASSFRVETSYGSST